MTIHTPGPWEFIAKISGSENHHGYFIRAQKPTRDGKWALAIVQPGDEDGRLGEANARLIAAAPNLLEALQRLVAHDEAADRRAGDSECYELGVARDAIYKATGERS